MSNRKAKKQKSLTINITFDGSYKVSGDKLASLIRQPTPRQYGNTVSNQISL